MVNAAALTLDPAASCGSVVTDPSPAPAACRGAGEACGLQRGRGEGAPAGRDGPDVWLRQQPLTERLCVRLSRPGCGTRAAVFHNVPHSRRALRAARRSPVWQTLRDCYTVSSLSHTRVAPPGTLAVPRPAALGAPRCPQPGSTRTSGTRFGPHAAAWAQRHLEGRAARGLLSLPQIPAGTVGQLRKPPAPLPSGSKLLQRWGPHGAHSGLPQWGPGAYPAVQCPKEGGEGPGHRGACKPPVTPRLRF